MDAMSIAGASPVGGTTDYFVIYEDGTTGHVQVSGGQEPALDRPGTFVTEERYGERLLELRAQHAAHVAALEAADEARQEADYAALAELGVPKETARRMSGYTGGQR